VNNHEQETSTTEHLLKGYAGGIFFTMSIGWLMVQIGRQIIPPLLPTIIDDLQITPLEAGIALTVLWAMYAFMHYPAGRLADQLSRKTVIVSGVIALMAGFSC
jgi:MFS family permease